MCKISIIVPVYNVEKYLEKCIDSLLEQSYKDFEIILVNDGSKDSSGIICDEYSRKHSIIKVVHKENEGLGLARNSGLEVAQGEYVTFIDSDDYAESELIKELYQEIKNTGADTCLGGFKRVNDSGDVIFTSSYKKQIYNENDVYEILLPRMIGSCPDISDALRMSVWNAMYSMKIIKENNIKFPSEREYISEDIMFDIEYYKYSKRVAIIDSSLYNYRVNVNSLTMKYKSDRFDMVKKLYKAIENKIINEMNDANGEILYRLQRQFFINIRECIKQENIIVSGLGKKESTINIKNICNDKLVQEIIKQYPINRLQIKPKIFLYLVKYKMYNLLYFLVRSNIF